LKELLTKSRHFYSACPAALCGRLHLAALNVHDGVD
jgi:hypothetical protein